MMLWHLGQRTVKGREGIFESSSCRRVVHWEQTTIMAFAKVSEKEFVTRATLRVAATSGRAVVHSLTRWHSTSSRSLEKLQPGHYRFGCACNLQKKRDP